MVCLDPLVPVGASVLRAGLPAPVTFPSGFRAFHSSAGKLGIVRWARDLAHQGIGVRCAFLGHKHPLSLVTRG